MLVSVVVLPSPVIVSRPDTFEAMDTHLHYNTIEAYMTTNTPIVEHIAPKRDLNLSPTHQAILASADKLFFIIFRGENTLRPHWYLVQIRLDDDEIPGYNQYFVDFFRKLPDDKKGMILHDIGLIGTRSNGQIKKKRVGTMVDQY